MNRTYVLRAAGMMVLAASLAGCKSSTEKAADKNLSDLKSTNKDAASTSVGAKSLPTECENYVTKVDACVKKLGSGNPAAGTFKQAMENARASWANIPDQVALANACKQADASFAQTSAAMGCQ